MLTKEYWLAALERALSAGAASATGGIVLDGATSANLNTWKVLAITFVAGFIFSILKGMAAYTTNQGTGPGFGRAEVTKEVAIDAGATEPPVVDGNDNLMGDKNDE